MRTLTLFGVLALAAPSLNAQDRAQARFVGVEPLAIVQALASELTPQKFELKKQGKKGALFIQDRGQVSQSNGQRVRVTLEVEFRMRQRGDTTAVTVEETLVGEAGRGFEHRKAMDPRQNRDAYLQLFEQIRPRLLAPRADTTRAVDSPRATE